MRAAIGAKPFAQSLTSYASLREVMPKANTADRRCCPKVSTAVGASLIVAADYFVRREHRLPERNLAADQTVRTFSSGCLEEM